MYLNTECIQTILGVFYIIKHINYISFLKAEPFWCAKHIDPQGFVVKSFAIKSFLSVFVVMNTLALDKQLYLHLAQFLHCIIGTIWDIVILDVRGWSKGDYIKCMRNTMYSLHDNNYY